MDEEEEKTEKLSEVSKFNYRIWTLYDKVSSKVCNVLREEIENVHKQRLEKVERKVSIKLIGKDPSKKV